MPFVGAALIIALVILGVLQWFYRARLASRDGKIVLLQRQRDDYANKLNGASPDEAKAQTDALAARILVLERQTEATVQAFPDESIEHQRSERRKLIRASRSMVQSLIAEAEADESKRFADMLEGTTLYLVLQPDLSETFKESMKWKSRTSIIPAIGGGDDSVAKRFSQELSRLELEWGLR